MHKAMIFVKIALFLLFFSLQAVTENSLKSDQFLIGKNIEITHPIEGDLYILAGQVVISRPVKGDVIVLGGNLFLLAPIEGSLRALGGHILVGAPISQNVTLGAGSVYILPQAQIGGNLTGAMGSLDIAGVINGDVKVMTGRFSLDSSIQGNVFVNARMGSIDLKSKAYIRGDFHYKCSIEAWVAPEAKIGGETVWERFLQASWLKGGKGLQKWVSSYKIFTKLMNIIYTFLLSLILWKFFPKALRSSFEQLHKGKIRSLLYGLMTLIILPLLAVILLVSVVGIPFALTLAALNLLTFYSSKSIVILWCAKNWASYLRYYSSTKQVALIAVSTLIYFFITSLPFIGSLVAFSFLLLGLGAVVLSTIAREKKFIFF